MVFKVLCTTVSINNICTYNELSRSKITYLFDSSTRTAHYSWRHRVVTGFRSCIASRFAVLLTANDNKCQPPVAIYYRLGKCWSPSADPDTERRLYYSYMMRDNQSWKTSFPRKPCFRPACKRYSVFFIYDFNVER